jgi:hypothetical protein
MFLYLDLSKNFLKFAALKTYSPKSSALFSLNELKKLSGGKPEVKNQLDSSELMKNAEI